jgi:hypothetical protein
MQSIFTGTANRHPNRWVGIVIVVIGALAIAAVVFATLRQSDDNQPALVGQRAAPYTQTNPYLGEGRLSVTRTHPINARPERAGDELLPRSGGLAPKAYYVPGAGEGLVGPQLQAFDRSLIEGGSVLDAASGTAQPPLTTERMRFLESNGVYVDTSTLVQAGGNRGSSNRR